MLVAIHLNAGDDRKGNERMGWAIVEAESGDIIDFIDIAYSGVGAFNQTYPGVRTTDIIMITVGEYREMLKLQKAPRTKAPQGERFTE